MQRSKTKLAEKILSTFGLLMDQENVTCSCCGVSKSMFRELDKPDPHTWSIEFDVSVDDTGPFNGKTYANVYAYNVCPTCCQFVNDRFLFAQKAALKVKHGFEAGSCYEEEPGCQCSEEVSWGHRALGCVGASCAELAKGHTEEGRCDFAMRTAHAFYLLDPEV